MAAVKSITNKKNGKKPVLQFKWIHLLLIIFSLYFPSSFVKMLSRRPCSDSSNTEELHFPPYFVLFALSCPLPWFLNHRKGEGDEFWGQKLKGRGQNWISRHFSAPFPEPREGCQPPAPSLPCPALPNPSASAHLKIPSQKPFATPRWVQDVLGKGVCLGHLMLFVLMCAPFPTPQGHCF